MKIVISGAGAVGTHLAKLLSAENHDIIVIDPDRDKLNFSKNNLEMITMVGSSTSLNDLSELGIKTADLFIGVTPEEAINITSCMLASKLGAKKTFARIDNFEYLLPKHKEFFESLGVDSMVYPEMLAAKEIVAAIKRPWLQMWTEMCGGALILIGAVVNAGSPLDKTYLYNFSSEQKKFHIVAIKRQGVTIIPRGDHQIMAGDTVFFMTVKENVNELPELIGRKNYDVKNIMIMGGSRIAIRTAQYLSDDIDIKLIESDREKCEILLDVLPKNVTIYHADGRNVGALEDEGIHNMDAFIAVTGNSEANILACMAAKRMGVTKTVAEVENMDYISMAENLEIGTIINKKLITVNNIYRFLLNADVSNIKSLMVANADVAEIVAAPNSKITQKEIKNIKFPKNVTIGGLVRNGEPVIVDGNTIIEPYDRVVVFCLGESLKEAERLFK